MKISQARTRISGQRSSTSRSTAMPYANYQTEQERHPDILSIFDNYGESNHSQSSLYMSESFYGGQQSWAPSTRTISVGPSPSHLLHPHYSSNDAYGSDWDCHWTGNQCSQSYPGAGSDSVLGSGLLSPSGSSQYSFSGSERATPSPMQLNEFSNVFESDFTRGSSSSHHTHTLPSASLISRRRASYAGPTASPYSRQSPELRKSREPSPTLSDPDSKRRFPCLVDGCSRRFTSQYTLKVHMEAHKPKPRVAFPCTMGCQETFSRQHDRLRHEVAKHGKVCEFSCEECGRFFSSSKTLGNHRCPVAQGGTRWVHL